MKSHPAKIYNIYIYHISTFASNSNLHCIKYTLWELEKTPRTHTHKHKHRIIISVAILAELVCKY